MSKQLTALLGIITLGIGGVSAIAYQTHAQSVVPSVTSTPAVSPVVAPPTDVKTISDTDHVQDDKGAIDTPDAPEASTVKTDTDKETNDDNKTGATLEKDQGEKDANSLSDKNEIEDAN